MELKHLANGNIIYKNNYPDNFDGDNAVEEWNVNYTTNHARVEVKEKWFEGSHISLIEVHPDLPEDFVFESSQQHICFLFCLSGAIGYKLNHEQDNFYWLTKNEQDINLGSIHTIRLRVTEQAKFLYIQLTENHFNKITGTEPANSPGIQEPIKPETSLILQHIINYKHEGRAKRLFLEARILELVIVYLNQNLEQQKVTFKQEDIDKIMLAKQLVEHDLQKPSSLIELSRKAGINDYKLKKGFKELTGHTVFGYLYKIRMEKAHYFLSKEKRSVNEVAFLVGYKNAQHFIAAFKKKYHILPGSLNKN
ncbi:AraC family transcriptional regulator [Pedobacter miscanthi]|jgi:AraC-like DNA-binding protein|uniref:helix-turn-helix domain-containing protein n=1 Tax=Pedobacter miscanthi TaxID=2259170 RepID=UPI002931C852|nr:AraC family transcriptional regulator [Pedobacter miscanthi]